MRDNQDRLIETLKSLRIEEDLLREEIEENGKDSSLSANLRAELTGMHYARSRIMEALAGN